MSGKDRMHLFCPVFRRTDGNVIILPQRFVQKHKLCPGITMLRQIRVKPFQLIGIHLTDIAPLRCDADAVQQDKVPSPVINVLTRASPWVSVLSSTAVPRFWRTALTS